MNNGIENATFHLILAYLMPICNKKPVTQSGRTTPKITEQISIFQAWARDLAFGVWRRGAHAFTIVAFYPEWTSSQNEDCVRSS